MKLQKLYAFIKTITQNPKKFFGKLNDSLREEEKQIHISKKYNLPLGLRTIDITSFSKNIDETIYPFAYLHQSSFPNDIMLLKILSKKFPNCRFLEIGTWRGESLANISKIAKECVSISLSDQELKKLGNSKEYIDAQRLFSKKLKNVQHISHNSHTYDYSQIGKFDLIFVDGDHSYLGVKKDTENVFKLRRNKKSIIVWHDGGKSTETTNWSVLAGILDGCPENERKFLYRISNTLCVAYIPEKIKSGMLTFPQSPTKIFKIKISSEKK